MCGSLPATEKRGVQSDVCLSFVRQFLYRYGKDNGVCTVRYGRDNGAWPVLMLRGSCNVVVGCY